MTTVWKLTLTTAWRSIFKKTTAASAMDPTVLHVLNKKLGDINKLFHIVYIIV